MLCKDNMANLDYKSKKNNAKHIFPLIYLFFFKKITKHLIMKCMNAMECVMQILKTKTNKNKKKKSTEEWSQRVER